MKLFSQRWFAQVMKSLHSHPVVGIEPQTKQGICRAVRWSLTKESAGPRFKVPIAFATAVVSDDLYKPGACLRQTSRTLK